MKFGYWGIRGAGQVPRLVLAYCGHEFEDVKYTEKEKWFDEDKKNIGFEFPNLPYLIDGDFKFTESKAIIYYAVAKAGKTELFGKDLKDQTVVMQLQGVYQDAMTALIPLFWNPKWEEALEGALGKVVPKLELMAKFYGEKEFAMGYLTLIDFVVAETSNHIEKIAPEVFAKFPFLAKTREAFNNLPEIKTYYAKETAVKGPFTAPPAAIVF